LFSILPLFPLFKKKWCKKPWVTTFRKTGANPLLRKSGAKNPK